MCAYLPSRVEDARLGDRKLIVDHSLYYFESEDQKLSLSLMGILNSTPARVYAASYVNRTGAAYCQYFGWIIALVPIPKEVISRGMNELISIAKEACFGNPVLLALDEL